MTYERIERIKSDSDFPAIVELLQKIAQEDQYTIPLSPEWEKSDESRLLRKMASLGIIHWCPYPEEFYILWPLGKEILGKCA
ncbi:MAG: hypothetical protein JSV88_19990 [Candidatus Aminicenantes bacterium]|nr:MAG: hypothetical protein JSV88_19990 [Candidatus Aminicenantes bacterium]